MNIRLGEKLLSDLRAASIKFDLPYSAIARKALRRARREGVPLETVDVESTYGGESIRFELEGLSADADTLRRALTWYLARHDLTPVKTGFSTDLREGKDYVVVGATARSDQ